MRYDTNITFANGTKERYVPGKGYVGAVTTVVKNANVTDLGITKSVQLFGEITTGQKVIRLPHPFTDTWSYVIIGDKKYKPITQLTANKGFAVVVGEFHE